MLSLDRLPRFAPDKVAMSEALRRLARTITISVSKTKLRIANFVECPVRTFDAPVEFQITCAQGHIAITVERQTITAILDTILPDWRAEAKTVLPFDWAATLVFDRLTQGTALADATLSLRMEPEGLEDAPCFQGMVKVLGQSRFVSVAVLDARLEHPVPKIGTGYRPLPLHLPIQIDVSFGAQPFSLDEVQALKTGDVLLLPAPASAGHLPAWMQINDGPAWSGTLSDTGHFSAMSRPEKESTDMDDDQGIPLESVGVEANSAGAPSEVISEPLPKPERPPFHDLNMTVDFQFRRKTMTLSDIQGIAPGAILDLGLDLADPIVIRVNEKQLGIGRLVQIGDRVGVQVNRWTRDPGGRS